MYGLAGAREAVYYGSTPGHLNIREFLGISLTDSIDFIRWKLSMRSGHYELNCQYGLSKAGTETFSDTHEVLFSGTLRKQGNYYLLQHEDRTLYILKINANLLHLLNKEKSLLVGNGGYSYTLNVDSPVKTKEMNLQVKYSRPQYPIAYHGRTPCQELSVLLELNSSSECHKLKWYIIFFVDPVSGKPSHYLKRGTAYRENTMVKGKWEIIRGTDGRVIYKLDPERKNKATHLLKADDNILLFTDFEGNLLVGNKHFSYTLNKTKEKEFK
jgi:hypothetical protein